MSTNSDMISRTAELSTAKRSLRDKSLSTGNNLDGTASVNFFISNFCMAAVNIWAFVTSSKKSSHEFISFFGSVTTFLLLMRFLNWYSVPPS